VDVDKEEGEIGTISVTAIRGDRDLDDWERDRTTPRDDWSRDRERRYDEMGPALPHVAATMIG